MKAELGNKFLASTKRDPAFISKGFKNWKDATIAFNAHLRSDCHKEGCEILELRSTTNDVAENLSKMYKEENELNRMMLIKFLQNVRFLARQGLSLRGHKDDEDSNFTQLLLLRSIGCPEVLTWMKKKPTSIPLVIFRMNFFKLWPCTFYVTSAPISSRMVSILSWLMSVLMYLIKSSSWSAYAGLTTPL